MVKREHFLASADARHCGRRVFRAALTTAGAGREGLSRRHPPYARCRRPAPSAASGAAASRGIRPRRAVRLWSCAGAAGPPADGGRQPGLKWSSQHFEGEVAMTGRRRRSDRSGRDRARRYTCLGWATSIVEKTATPNHVLLVIPGDRNELVECHSEATRGRSPVSPDRPTKIVL